jgi:hypothetical protein
MTVMVWPSRQLVQIHVISVVLEMREQGMAVSISRRTGQPRSGG